MLAKLVFFWCFADILAHVRLTDEEYSLMPPVFYMDDYDRCMQIKEESLFCAVTYQLAPLRNESVPKVWTVLEKIRNDRSYYRHDKLRYQICVRHTCPNALFKKGEELKEEINQCFDETYKNYTLKGTVIDLNCVTSESINSRPLKISHIIIAIVAILYLLLVLCASLYDATVKKLSEENNNNRTKKNIGALLSAFSIPKNYYRFMSKNTDPSVEQLKVLNGLKFFSMCFTILGHVGLLHFSGAVINPKATEEITKSIFTVILINGTLIVHTFFAISAFLLTYHFYKIMEKNDKVQPKTMLMAVVNRLVRLLPSLAVTVILIAIGGQYYSGGGPVWHLMMKPLFVDSCESNGWTNILFINNIVNSERMCLGHTWYLAVDMQLYLVTILILGIIWKYRNLEKLLFSLCFIFGILMPAYLAYTQRLDMVLTEYPEDLYNFISVNNKIFRDIYISTPANFGGWMVGVIFGYFYYYKKDVKFFTKKIYVVFWWILFLSAIFIPTLTGGTMYLLDNYEYNPLHSALNWSLSRPSWALGVVILIFGVSQGIGWLLKWVLELDVFRVLARLTYGAYLLHPIFTGYRISFTRTPVYTSHPYIVFLLMGDICMAFIGSFIMCILVQMPFTSLQKAFL